MILKDNPRKMKAGRFILALYFRKNRKFTRRIGLTLIEVMIAITVGTISMMGAVMSLADGVSLQLQATRIAVASSIAQARMTQLLSHPNLERFTDSGSFGDDHGIYAGYEYDISVREEQIDLADVAASGELNANIDDQLPPPVQNQGEAPEQSRATQTGGLVDIHRIVIIIRYPSGNDQMGEYRLETFRHAGN